MADKKTLAIILGTTAGIAAVAVAVAVYVANNREEQTADVNDVFDQARKTVQKLDEAIESLRSSAA